MFSTEGTDDPEDLHTDEEISIRDRTRLMLRKAANMLRAVSTWPGHSYPGGPSVTGATAALLDVFLTEQRTIAFLGKPGSRQHIETPSEQGQAIEQIAKQVMNGWGECTQTKADDVFISLSRTEPKERGGPWQARALSDDTKEICANGIAPEQAMYALRERVMMELQKRSKLIDDAIQGMSTA